ncbi:hypothetical protein CIPAW_05G221900 [Carya illinoinensis]|uniref:Uncharacterized protein n=1 Tax=Carya illinoinensis TaxID=32201 RepID=A0A8T1QN24_CARIL|nr:hypothetical protein CIPAW_05G221900 [Carya illinoinensis]
MPTQTTSFTSNPSTFNQRRKINHHHFSHNQNKQFPHRDPFTPLLVCYNPTSITTPHVNKVKGSNHPRTMALSPRRKPLNYTPLPTRSLATLSIHHTGFTARSLSAHHHGQNQCIIVATFNTGLAETTPSCPLF